ncbi:ECF transporter S component [Anaerofustis stercorihominis]|uniref:ECF transporter S component n=1 Tax=Anaerofustis stercorihominis TaxID=214853 RepID=UPI00214B496D|nr:ECF transporter S component [Anaerofustis stercorihominis]MCR2033071.1 ECF transporter S component [Anaerofustis stercorihominis]
MANKKTLNVVLTGVMAALIFIATYINIRLPISFTDGGLIHLGGSVLVIATFLLMPVEAGLAGAIGMGLFDMLSPYAVWAPFTFVIRLIQGIVVSKLLLKKGISGVILAMVIYTIIGMGGYYLAEALIYGNWIAPMASMPGEFISDMVAIVIGVPIAKILIKNKICYKTEQY